MNATLIDLSSDTQTRPSQAMRQVIANAPVGDEQRGEDPSVNKLCEMVCELTGKEAAVFLPSGTMCNEIAVLVHCRPGDEIITDESAHLFGSEAGAPAALAGVMVRPVVGPRGVFSADQAEAAVRDHNRYTPTTRMIVIEQTANFGGGTVWTLDQINAIDDVAKRHDLIMHMDGARLMNAVVASGVSAREFSEPFDSCWIDLSKGLGCPFGGVLAGTADFIEQAWLWKQRIGGAMRQAGLLAAAGVYAFENNVERLAEDHANARLFAESIADIPNIAIEPETVETNIIFFDASATGLTAEEISKRLEEHGVRIGPIGNQLRAITHLDVSKEQVVEAAKVVRAVFAGL